MSFNKKYIFAVSIIILLLISNQIVIQYWLHQKQNDANLINISGKQRMLSQKITTLFYEYHFNPNNKTKKELNENLIEWASVHEKLLSLNEKGIIDGQKIIPNNLLNTLDKEINVCYSFYNRIDNLSKTDLTKLDHNQDRFLIKMDKVVYQLEALSKNRLTRIIKIELLLASISLFVILFEILFIFRPMILELIKKNEALENNNQVLEEYAYIAAHDLRTPIRSIHNFLVLFLKSAKPKLNQKELNFLTQVTNSTLRMNETTKDLLLYSVSNKLNKEVVNVNQLLEDLIIDLNAEITSSNAEIVIKNLPDSSYVDKDMFRLLFQNLITNSIKFTPKNRNPKIAVSFEETKSTYQFCISDNGIGIPSKDAKSIFKIFKRLYREEDYNGTGIGLALCKRIVESHEGKIWVTSQEGIGSTFVFEIPKSKN